MITPGPAPRRGDKDNDQLGPGMPSWSIVAWWIGTARSFEPATMIVGQAISARRGLLSNAMVSRHADTINVRSWSAMSPASQASRSLPSCLVPRETTSCAIRCMPRRWTRTGRRWPSSFSRGVAMLKA